MLTIWSTSESLQVVQMLKPGRSIRIARAWAISRSSREAMPPDRSIQPAGRLAQVVDLAPMTAVLCAVAQRAFAPRSAVDGAKALSSAHRSKSNKSSKGNRVY
jgi:hypothetical protein